MDRRCRRFGHIATSFASPVAASDQYRRQRRMLQHSCQFAANYCPTSIAGCLQLWASVARRLLAGRSSLWNIHLIRIRYSLYITLVTHFVVAGVAGSSWTSPQRPAGLTGSSYLYFRNSVIC